MIAALLLLAFQAPNVLLIRADDLDCATMAVRRPDTNALVLRNVSQMLAAHGMTFESSYVSFSLCAPSRASCLTGQYAHNHHVYGVSPPVGGYPALDHTNTLPVWLQTSGYYTIHVGKYLNSMPTSARPPGWSEWFAIPDPHYYNYHLNENGTVYFHGASAADYSTDVLTARAVAFIEHQRSGPAPFYMQVDYVAPHWNGIGYPDQLPPAPRHAGVMDALVTTHGPAYNEADVTDKPSGIQALPQFTLSEKRAIDKEIRGRAGTMLSVDEGIGAIVQALADVGELDETVIIFTSDNGYMQGEHRIATGKIAFYEESSRVPLIFRGPGVQAGSCTAVVGNVDLAPTVVDLAGATAGLVMDGLSMRPFLDGSASSWSRTFLFESFETSVGSGSVHSLMNGLRYQGGSFTEFDYDENGAVDERELYDIGPDPFELASQHADPARAMQMQSMHAIIVALRGCSGATCQ